MPEYYLKILRKRWILIVICFIFTGLVAYIGSRLMTPVYQSTVVIQVAVQANNSQADIQGLLASDQLVQTESQLASSGSVLSAVVPHYPGLTVDQLAKSVSSTVESNTQLFQIQVLDPSPAKAAALANAIASALIQQQIQTTLQADAPSKQQMQQDLQQTETQIQSISGQIAKLQSQANELTQSPSNTGTSSQGVNLQFNALETQISSLQARLGALQQQDAQWQTLIEQLALTEAQSSNLLRIVQPAQPATSPVRPNVVLNTAIGLSVGLMNGILLAILLEQLDTRVHTAEDISELLGWPVLATIWRPDSKSEALINPPAHSANSEAYRILRTNLGFSVVDKPLHSIMVTSAAPGEGKSTTAANLAIFMALAGKKTLLIDADLRRPTISEKFQLGADRMGLTNAIMAYAQYQSVASKMLWQSRTPFPTGGLSPNAFIHTTGIPNLQIMPSGPRAPNPSELLDSKAMESLLAGLANCGAEVIIFDTPPLLGLSDASILSSKADGILLVVDSSHATKKNLKQVKPLIAQVGGQVLGCVVNKHQRSRKDSSSYYYYYYQAEEVAQSMQNGHNITGEPAALELPIPGTQQ